MSLYFLICIIAISIQVQCQDDLEVKARTAVCYNCTNLYDPHNYCNHSDIENMPTAHCDTDKCLFYVIQRVFIDQVLINRSCMTNRADCQTLRDAPGNDIRQCIICGWDLCNGGQSVFQYAIIFLIALVVFIVDYL